MAVLANAGSGKTTVLTLRYLWLVLISPQPVEEIVKRIVAITFTTKAAAEMRERIHALVEEFLHDAQKREQLRTELQIDLSDDVICGKLKELRNVIGNARISTFHSFCAGLLRLYGHEIGVDPESREVSDRDAATMVSSAIRKAIREMMSDDRDRLYALYDDLDIDAVESAVESFVRRPEDLEHERQWFAQFPNVDAIVDARQERAFEFFASKAIAGLNEILADVNVNCAPKKGESDDFIRIFRETVTASINGDLSAWKRLPEILPFAYTQKGTGRKSGGKFSGTADLEPIPDEVFRAIIVLATQQDRDAEVRQVLYVQTILDLAWTARATYQAEKRQLRLIDFDDMMGLCVRLMEERAEIAAIIRSGITYLMVDEFQDTNPLQYDLVCHLVPDLRDERALRKSELFIVGDDKQSIYGFRGADVALFRQAVKDVRTPAVIIPTSYRMAPPLAAHVNTICEPIFNEAIDQDIPYTPLVAGRTNAADDAGTLQLLITSPTPDADDDRTLREQELAHVVGRLRALLNVHRPGDIAVLCRSVNGVSITSTLLHEAGIPFQAHGGRAFYSRPEIADVRNVLRLCADGGDAKACAAVLRSPMFGLTDTEIYEVLASTDDGTLSLRALNAAAERLPQSTSIVNASTLLTQLTSDLMSMPLPLFVRHALQTTRWHATLFGDRRREQGIANVDKLVDIIRAEIERSGATLRDVIDRISVPDEDDREAESRFDVDRNTVQVMTIHAAKGLEFPVVFLCDISTSGRNGTITTSERFGTTISLADKIYVAGQGAVDRPRGLTAAANAALNTEVELDEDRRLLYVALTRAKDHAYVSVQKPVLKNGGLGVAKGISRLLRPLVFGDACPFPILEDDGSVSGGDVVATSRPILDRTMTIAPPERPDHINASELAHDAAEAIMAGSRWSSTDAMLIGTSVHYAIADLLTMEARGDEEESVMARHAPQREDLCAVYHDHLRRVRSSALWQKLQQYDTLLVEKDFIGLDGDTLVTGRIDVAAFVADDHLHIWDWKTNDITTEEQAEHMAALYRPQMETYRWLVQRRYPHVTTITTTLVFTALEHGERTV